MLLSLLLAASCAPGVSDAAPLRIGEPAPAISLKDIRYLPRSVAELGAGGPVVLVFVTRECPLAKRYLPRVVEIEREYRPRGVRVAFVNVGAEETIVDAATPMAEAGVAAPLLKDFDAALARAVGVTRTPQAVVFDSELRLRYRGRIDDQMRLSGAREKPTREDLKRAIEDLLAGRAVEVAETPAEGCALEEETPPAPAPDLDWAAHIGRIVIGKCAPCHRRDGEAPFPLVEYGQVKKRLDMIDEVVRERRMPPWYGSADYGEFGNHRGLTRGELKLLRAWIAAGAPEGDPADAPPPPPPAPKWKIGEPDLVLTQVLADELPATGLVPYRYVVMPHVFLEDTYLEAIEIQGSNKPVLHHANLAYFEIGEPYRQENFITGFVPGGDPMDLAPLREGLAVRIPAGSVLGLQVHYITTGKPETNRVSVGLRFPKRPIAKLLRQQQITNTRFEIPPHAPAHPVVAGKKFERAFTAIGMFPHMHLRGRDMTYVAKFPDGSREVLLVVPNYDFDWQQSYPFAKPRSFPAGTRIEVTAHFDNSRFNPFNPDPDSPVRFGLQTEEEMMYGFFFFTWDDEALDLVVDPKSGQP